MPQTSDQYWSTRVVLVSIVRPGTTRPLSGKVARQIRSAEIRAAAKSEMPIKDEDFYRCFDFRLSLILFAKEPSAPINFVSQC